MTPISFLLYLVLYCIAGVIALYIGLKMEDVTYEEVESSEKTLVAVTLAWPLLVFYITLWVTVKPVMTYLMSRLGEKESE